MKIDDEIKALESNLVEINTYETGYLNGLRYARSMYKNFVDIEDVKHVLTEAGQSSKRYKLGETWELNLIEILDALEKLEKEK